MLWLGPTLRRQIAPSSALPTTYSVGHGCALQQGTMTTGGRGWDGGDTLGVCYRGLPAGRQSSTLASLTQMVALL